MKKEKKKFLSISEGIEQPDNTNPDAIEKLTKIKKHRYSVDEYIYGILNRNITILSQAITIIESKLPEHYELAQEIIERCLPYSEKSIRIGITGVPGAGKSTFIETIGTYITNQGHRLAVLAIDPSSQKSSGSILGDKTRMEKLSTDKNAFIRPSPTSGTLGGVARKTKETIILCEAAGFDVILVETVGVGQSETAVSLMVDYFLLLMIAGAGDELQRIKRGIIEMADCIVINKADGDNVGKANQAKRQFENALHLMPLKESGLVPNVLTCSALMNTGIKEIYDLINHQLNELVADGYFEQNRKTQSKYWMHETIKQGFQDQFYNDSDKKDKITELEKLVTEGKISSFKAARILLDDFFKK